MLRVGGEVEVMIKPLGPNEDPVRMPFPSKVLHLTRPGWYTVVTLFDRDGAWA